MLSIAANNRAAVRVHRYVPTSCTYLYLPSRPEDFATALERRLERRQLPHSEAMNTAGAAMREPPSDDSSVVGSPQRSEEDDKLTLE